MLVSILNEWDIAADGTILWMRRPGEGRSQLGHEHQVLQITRVKLWPVVGRPAHFFFDDLADPFTEHWRLTTAAVSIEAGDRREALGPITDRG